MGWGRGRWTLLPAQPRVLTLLCNLIPQKAGPWAELFRLGTKLSLPGLGNCNLKFHFAKSCFCKRSPHPASVTGSSLSAGCECCVKQNRSPLPEFRVLGCRGALTGHNLGGTEGHRRVSPCSDKAHSLRRSIVEGTVEGGGIRSPNPVRVLGFPLRLLSLLSAREWAPRECEMPSRAPAPSYLKIRRRLKLLLQVIACALDRPWGPRSS